MKALQAAVLGAALGAGGCVFAAYPDKPVRLIVPFPSGGGTDVTARAIALKLTEQWGQSVVVDNRPGAASMVGTEILAHSVPDGYTLGFVSIDRKSTRLNSSHT